MLRRTITLEYSWNQFQITVKTSNCTWKWHILYKTMADFEMFTLFYCKCIEFVLVIYVVQSARIYWIHQNSKINRKYRILCLKSSNASTYHDNTKLPLIVYQRHGSFSCIKLDIFTTPILSKFILKLENFTHTREVFS